MGIKDLLRFMKPHIKPIHIKKYAGKRVGIDAYAWLHKGAYSCSMEICLDSNSDKKLRYLDYFMHRINLLRYYNITPVVVFDGGNIPCKAATEHERYRRRKANSDLAMEKLEEGNVNAASELFQRAVNITPFMAHQLIRILRSESIEFVVAPYEADAQLAYLSSLEDESGGITAVITEDSDLLAYGCEATIFKMDRYGNGEEIVLDEVFGAVAHKPSFQSFDKELFIGMCVLAGCDFLPSIPGIGIVKAHSFVSKYRNLDRVLSVLKLEKCSQVPEDYSKSFREAIAVFQHAQIYDARSMTLKHMKPLSQDLMESLNGKLDFLGPGIPPSVAIAIAEGKLNPTTLEAFDCSPSSRYPDPIVIHNRCDLQKPDGDMLSKQKRRLMELGFTSHKSRERAITGVVIKQDRVSTERKYVDEALALQKIISPPKIHRSEQAVAPNELPLKIPNNPFMIRKHEEIQLDQTQSSGEQISVVIDHEELNIFWVTDKSLLKKRKHDEVQLDQEATITEQASEVTRGLIESTDMVVTNESQESVSSKPKKLSDGRGTGGSPKSKRSNCRSMENKKGTILNFFSRV